MFSKIFSAVKGLFSVQSSKIGIIFTILFAKASVVIAKEILDKENQRMAYEFVKELNDRQDLDNGEKRKVFNKKMGEWMLLMGKKVHESVLNCLRELAVNALKVENE